MPPEINSQLPISNSQGRLEPAPATSAFIRSYSPLRHFGVKAGASVAVVGLGGLGHMGVKLAKAMGARVTALSHSPGKRSDALRLGADEFVATRDVGVLERYAGRFEFILDTVSALHDYDAYLNLLQRNGTMVLVGVPEPVPGLHRRSSAAGGAWPGR